MSCLPLSPYTFTWCEVWSGKLSFTHILMPETEPEELKIFHLAKTINTVARDSQSKAASGWQKSFVLLEREVNSSGHQSTFFLCLQKCVVSLQWRSNTPHWWLKLQRKVFFLSWTKNKLQEKQLFFLWETRELLEGSEDPGDVCIWKVSICAPLQLVPPHTWLNNSHKAGIK